MRRNLQVFSISLFAIALLCCKRKTEEKPVPQTSDVTSVEGQALATYARRLWLDESPAPIGLSAPTEGVYVAARNTGQRLAARWGDGASVAKALAEALEGLQAELGQKTSAATHLEIFVIQSSTPVDPMGESKRLRSNIHRGVVGLAVGKGADEERYSPSYVLASNRSHQRLMELYSQNKKKTEEQMANLPYRFLRGPQLLVDLQQPSFEAMARGNHQVQMKEVTRPSVQAFADRMATWMHKSLHEDGRMTYLYWPSQGQEAAGRDNLIRQFMASIALGRIAARSGSSEDWQHSAQNIDFNLKKYYRQEQGLGFVELRHKVKLGAVALAALAIVEHKERTRWQEQEAALLRTVQSLWQEDGSFVSFYRPAGRNDNQNFYPGEALLLWATLYRESHDEALLAQITKSFRYYRDWHLDPTVERRRNPAFTPWHSQAYYLVWAELSEGRLKEEMASFIFEMNDWLLGVQEWQGSLYPDTRGRFYDADRPFGPPHASATGVYLEGLIDAFRLAEAVGDKKRSSAYAQSIRRGLRSSMQLQFVDDTDMFYVHNRDAVFGGLRTTVYDNQIRCDNVQHTLMGTLKILDATNVLTE